MKKLLFAALAAAWLCAPAHAQTMSAYTVSSCGGQSLAAGQPFPLTMDLTGKLCDGASGGTSGSPYYVQASAGSFADGWNVTEGTKADAASTATDTTPVTQMSVEKQISKSAQAAVTALGSPFQAGGNIGNTAFGATESGTWQVTPTVPAASTMNLTSITTAYTANQLVANNGTAGSITNPSFSMPSAGGAIPRLRLYSDDTGTGWQGATVQVDLWSSSPTWTNGDHAAWKPATGTAAHLASFSCTFPSAVWGDGLATECSINQGNYASTVATTIYWSVEVITPSTNAVTASQHLNLRPELN